eukprot:3887586-Heterocapsa_arctica.AAC.1
MGGVDLFAPEKPENPTSCSDGRFGGISQISANDDVTPEGKFADHFPPLALIVAALTSQALCTPVTTE